MLCLHFHSSQNIFYFTLWFLLTWLTCYLGVCQSSHVWEFPKCLFYRLLISLCQTAPSAGFQYCTTHWGCFMEQHMTLHGQRYMCTWEKYTFCWQENVLCSHSGCCGSVDWAPAYEPKGGHSQSGHRPGLQARYLIRGTQEATDWCISRTLMFLSLSSLLPSPLSKSK